MAKIAVVKFTRLKFMYLLNNVISIKKKNKSKYFHTIQILKIYLIYLILKLNATYFKLSSVKLLVISFDNLKSNHTNETLAKRFKIFIFVSF